jgi:hypothetical protein
VQDKDAALHSWCRFDAIQAKLGCKTKTHVRVIERITEIAENIKNPKKSGSQIGTPIPAIHQKSHQIIFSVQDKDATSHSWFKFDAIQAKLGGKTETHVRVMERITEVRGNVENPEKVVPKLTTQSQPLIREAIQGPFLCKIRMLCYIPGASWMQYRPNWEVKKRLM